MQQDAMGCSLSWCSRVVLIEAGHNKLNEVARASEAQGGNGSRVKVWDFFVRRHLKSPRPCAFHLKELCSAVGNVAMAANSCYKEREVQVNVKYFANSDMFSFFFEIFL